MKVLAIPVWYVREKDEVRWTAGDVQGWSLGSKDQVTASCHQQRSSSKSDTSRQKAGTKMTGLTLNLGKLQ